MSSHIHRDRLRSQLAAKRSEAELLRVQMDVAKDAYARITDVIIGLEAELYQVDHEPGPT